jgi:hypothetical protein
VPKRGLEPVDVTHSGNKQLRNPVTPGGAESGAVGAENTSIDPDLARVIEAWPKLPTAIRSAISVMINTKASEPE